MNAMHENTVLKERAVLVSLRVQRQYESAEVADFSLRELRQLAETAGVDCVAELIQNRERIDTKWFVGKGKVDELKEVMQQTEATTAIFDSELSGSQVRNLEGALDAKIIDRTQLILDIFAQRANTREGILQVELAQLQYLLPRLSGHGKNLSRLGGGIGTRGPGETKLETDRRHIRRKITDLKEQIDEIAKHRNISRERRQKVGVTQVALVGYTNAGKSTLLNRLTEASVFAEDLLFATLDTTSRQLQLPNGTEIVITDTVGFIQNLPHDLVAAFKATLEEVCEADLILHVVDSSSPMRDLQMNVVQQVLTELGAHQAPQLVLFNKCDLLLDPSEIMTATEPSLLMSAKRAEDLLGLKLKLQEMLAGEQAVFRIPLHRGDLLSQVYRIGEVVEESYDEEYMTLSVKLNVREFNKIGYILTPYREGV